MNLFPPTCRLQKPWQFKQVWDTGKKLSGKYFAIVSCKNLVEQPRLGISVAKKNIRSAVNRNRLKRLTRETFRCRQQQLQGFDFVVVIYKGADKLLPAEQFQSINELWDRLASKLNKVSSACC